MGQPGGAGKATLVGVDNHRRAEGSYGGSPAHPVTEVFGRGTDSVLLAKVRP